MISDHTKNQPSRCIHYSSVLMVAFQMAILKRACEDPSSLEERNSSQEYNFNLTSSIVNFMMNVDEGVPFLGFY